jgi:benzoate/toluate 1,2-dioxygenase reductase subunit
MKKFTLAVARVQWLTQLVFEIRFTRPHGFDFLPGQKIRFIGQAVTRDYTLTNAPDDPELSLCIRHVPQGRFSPRLAHARTGEQFSIEGPFGFFTLQPFRHPAVFVATGTGIAPFVAYARAGFKGFFMLHGVRAENELYYRSVFTGTVCSYIPCLSSSVDQRITTDFFAGRVTGFLERRLETGLYDFYLCGRSDMIGDAMDIIDSRFGGSRVFSEIFF